MVVERREVETKFNERERAALVKLEVAIDVQLAQKWNPGMKQLEIHLSHDFPRQKVQDELRRRYAPAGWLLSFRSFDDRNEIVTVVEVAAYEPEEDRR